MKKYSLLIQQYRHQDATSMYLDDTNGSLQDANCSIDCDCPCLDNYYDCSDCFDCSNCSCCDSCDTYDCCDYSSCGCCACEMAICECCDECSY